MQQLGTARDLFSPPAVEGGGQADGAAVQCRRHGEHLKGGPRLIAVGEHPVAPLLPPGIRQSLGIGLRVAAAFQQKLQLQGRLFVRDFQIVIGVVAAQGRHGQYFPGFAVHHQAESPVLHIIAVNGRRQLLFQTCLHRAVQGEDHIRPLPGGQELFIREGHIHFVIALGGDDSPGAARQVAVVGGFDSLGALVGSVGKADHLSGQGALGVGADGGWFQMDTGDAVLPDVGPDDRRGFLRDAASHLLVAPAQIRGLGLDPVRVLVQHPAQELGDGRNIRFGLLQLVGVQVDILPVFGKSQDFQIPVIDGSPVGGDGGGTGLVPQRQVGIVIVLCYHQAVQPDQHGYKGKDAQENPGQHHAPVLAAVHPQSAELSALPVSHPPPVPFS